MPLHAPVACLEPGVLTGGDHAGFNANGNYFLRTGSGMVCHAHV